MNPTIIRRFFNIKEPKDSCSMYILFYMLFVFSHTLFAQNPALSDPNSKISLKPLFIINKFSKEQNFSSPMGIYYDKYHDELYVADTGNNQVDIFDIDGQPLFQITSIQRLEAPIDVIVNMNGQIYISQMERKQLQIYNFRGNYITDLHTPNDVPFKPGRMCLDSKGNLYVVDREKARILVYDAEGNYLFQFGERGEGQGKFQLISGIDVDNNGRVYVADSKQIPVQIFDSQGKFLTSFGTHGTDDHEFSFPGGISIDKKDRIWIADTFRHQIKVFKTDGSFLFQFGELGTESGHFFFPIDLAIDEHNKLYVLEKGANRIQVFEIDE